MGDTTPVRKLGACQPQAKWQCPLAVASLAFLLAIGLAVSPVAGQTISAQNNSSDIHISLQRRPNAPRSVVTLCISNAGDYAITLNLGRNMRPVFVTITLQRKTGPKLDWNFVEGGIAPGRTDPFVLPMPEGAAVCLPLDLKQFAAAPNYEGLKGLPPGDYTVQATLEGHKVNPRALNPDATYFSLLQYWTGKAVSSPVHLNLP